MNVKERIISIRLLMYGKKDKKYLKKLGIKTKLIAIKEKNNK